MSERFTEIVSDVLQIPVSEIDMHLSPETVETWDSLNHLRLIAAFEAEYSVRLSMAEIRDIANLEDLRSAFSKAE